MPPVIQTETVRVVTKRLPDGTHVHVRFYRRKKKRARRAPSQSKQKEG